MAVKKAWWKRSSWSRQGKTRSTTSVLSCTSSLIPRRNTAAMMCSVCRWWSSVCINSASEIQQEDTWCVFCIKTLAVFFYYMRLQKCYMWYWSSQKTTHSSGLLSQPWHLLTIDNILPLDSLFVLLLAEFVFYCETPRLSPVIHSISWDVTVDICVHTVCGEKCKFIFQCS